LSNRSENELVDIYGRENVRVNEKGRAQVLEEHFHRPGGRVVEWVEADDALPPADPSDVTGINQEEVVVLDDPVPVMTEEDYAEAKEDEEDDEDAE
jgi:hypothetical protein